MNFCSHKSLRVIFLVVAHRMFDCVYYHHAFLKWPTFFLLSLRSLNWNSLRFLREIHHVITNLWKRPLIYFGTDQILTIKRRKIDAEFTRYNCFLLFSCRHEKSYAIFMIEHFCVCLRWKQKNTLSVTGDEICLKSIHPRYIRAVYTLSKICLSYEFEYMSYIFRSRIAN